MPIDAYKILLRAVDPDHDGQDSADPIVARPRIELPTEAELTQMLDAILAGVSL